MASPPSPIPKTLAHLRAHLPTYLSKTTNNIAHTNRLLSSIPTLDTTLLTLTYTLHLLKAALTKRPALLPRLTSSLAPLTALLDELRIFLRLWGLLGIYTWGASTYHHPPRDRVIEAITWAQVAACAVFQGLENGAFLAERRVLGWRERTVARAWVWSSRAWMAHVGLELVRLGYEWRGRAGREAGGAGKGELQLRDEKVERERWWGAWKRDLVVNVAYAPMTVHYSVENGLLGEGATSVLGLIVGLSCIGEAWKKTA